MVFAENPYFRDVLTPLLSELKRALRWLRAQYQKRAEEAARGQDGIIERIRKAKEKRLMR